MNDQLHYCSASEALRRFAARELSPVELMQAVLERAQRLSGSLNATTAIHADAAIARARESEQRYRAGTQRPLEGLPVAIKEETAVAGWHRTNGSHLLDEVPQENHPIVDKLIGAGAIPHIQTTVPEFCVIGQTLSSRWGVTRNPWNRDYTCGGSSGGSGAALAAGLAPLATGSDMAGSIRIPAALQGLYGYKPPFGRLAPTPGEELFAFAVEGPMARDLQDLLRMQNVIAGPHPSTYVGMPYRAAPLEYPDLRGSRIAYSLTTGSTAICADTRRNFFAACDGLRARGAEVEAVDIRWDNAELAETLIEAIFGLFFNEYLQKISAAQMARTSPYLAMLIHKYRGRANSIMKSTELASRLHREMQAKVWAAGYRAFLCPTVFTTAVPAALDISVSREILIEDTAVDSYLGWVGTPPFNLLSRYPALAVPTGVARTGIPTSLQIVGPPFDDEAVFHVAHNHAEVGGGGLFRTAFPSLDER